MKSINKRACGSCLQPRAAFTMIELVTVTVIVALAAVFLMRTVATVQGTSNDLACRSNLQQIGSALFAYTLDHKGYFPYGYYYPQSDPATWQNVSTGRVALISWPIALHPYVTPGAPELSPIFRCPLAIQTVPHRIGYVINMIVGVAPYAELLAGQPPRAQTRPSKVELMRKEGNALVWDTAPRGFPGLPDGYLIGADLDGQRFWNGAATPQMRYFLAHDPYGSIPPGVFGHNRPVQLYSSGMPVFRNTDPAPPPAGPTFPYQGNLRFRHGGNTVCHALFSDRSVRHFTAVLGNNDTVTSHDAIRRLFQTDWPPGVTPNPSHPH